MRHIVIFFFIFTLAYAKTPYELGKKLYLQKGCYSCHGHKAEGMHAYPALANRAKGYMTYKLKRFRSKLSDNQQQEMMIPFAVGLSDEDIENLTTFMYDFIDEESNERYDDSYQVSGDGGS
ncbi:MAG: cytochrome c [Sulfurimonas sp.]|nr:cytochrome c [Sulfurimonas sp.]